jgi:glutamyl-tRNA synthetase
VNWRFRVTDDEVISFVDGHYGPQEFVAGRDFGDFVVWRHDDLPSYQLAVVVDDAAMAITEVVRGEDLLKSTARQLLIYRTLGLIPPNFYHCPLITDETGIRLAKRHDALSLRNLRARGASPGQLRENLDDRRKQIIRSRKFSHSFQNSMISFPKTPINLLFGQK